MSAFMMLASFAVAADRISVQEVNRVLTTPSQDPARLVTIRAVVTHSVERLRSLCVQEGDHGVGVKVGAGLEVPPVGAEVELDVRVAYRSQDPDTVVTAEAVRILGQPGPPPPAKARLADMFGQRFNRKAVEVEAVVLGASERNGIWFLFLTDGSGTANGLIHQAPAGWKPDGLVGSRIVFRGVCAGHGYNALRATTPDEIRVLGPAEAAQMQVTDRVDELQKAGIEGARKGGPVRLRGVCTYPNSKGIHFYLHDGTGGIVVNLTETALCPKIGEEVEIVGVSSGYQNVVGVHAFNVIPRGKGKLPEPRALPVEAPGQDHFSQWVEVEGVIVQAAGHAQGAVQFFIAGEKGWCGVVVQMGQSLMKHWEGARVRLRGLNAGQSHLMIFCGEPGLVTVLSPGRAEPFEAPRVEALAIRTAGKSDGARTRVEGVVLDVRDGWIYLRDGNAAFRAELLGGFPMQPSWDIPLTKAVPSVLPETGQVVEIVGSPAVQDGSVSLRLGQVRLLRKGDMPAPRLVGVPEVMGGRVANDLVMVRGRLRDYSSGEAVVAGLGPRWRETLRLEQDGAELEIVNEEPGNRGAFAGFKIDDRIEATGIVRFEPGTPAYRLRSRSLADVHTLGIAPEVLWTRQLRILGIAGTALAAAGVWVALLRSKLKRERQIAVERARADEATRAMNTTLESRVIQRTAELQKTQEDLRRALEVEREMGELKSRFVALVSHEFRTPLGITMSAVELLRGYMDRLPEDQRKELLDDIHSATVRMAGMMEQVLLLGRVEAGSVGFDAVPLEVEDICRKFTDEVQSATNRKCTVQFRAEGDLAGAAGDEGLLRHIFSNLISNAVKYSPEGAQVEFGVRREGKDAVFTVRDRGIGIPPEDQARLFEAFHRASNVGQTQGTGLGLLIVKRCVELHRGKLSFDSRVGEGTTFTVSLPLFEDPTA